MMPMPLLERLRTDPLPEVLYHYTNPQGLLGILESNCLWATSARYLNDSSEFSYGLGLIGKAIEEGIRETEDEQERVFLGNTRRNHSEFPCVGVVSLTQKGDLLSQWRGYGGGSGGFSLGLRPEHLRSVCERQGFYLAKCIYSMTEQRAATQTLIDEFRERAGSELNSRPHASGSALADRLAVLLKHESFQEEQEWRLISTPRSVVELDFRPGVSTLVPYSKFDLGKNRNAYVHSVTIGPTPHPELTKDSVRMLLTKLNVTDPEKKVFATQIPYRNW